MYDSHIHFVIRTTLKAPPITYLFVPGDRPERFAKAQATGAGMVVIDLEDAVKPDDKDLARARVAEALSDGELRACVRINGGETPWFAEDLRLLSLTGVTCVMVPKAEHPDVLAAVHAAAGPRATLIPLVETARGLGAARLLGECSSVLRLAFGSVDFQRDLAIEGDGEELLFARSRLVLASRQSDLAAPIDGVTLAVGDFAQTHQDAVRARRLGFGGKLCIHPAQVAPVMQAFMPDEKAIAWAKSVLAAAASASTGALTFEGKLIDKPVIDRAKTLLARAAS